MITVLADCEPVCAHGPLHLRRGDEFFSGTLLSLIFGLPETKSSGFPAIYPLNVPSSLSTRGQEYHMLHRSPAQERHKF